MAGGPSRCCGTLFRLCCNRVLPSLPTPTLPFARSSGAQAAGMSPFSRHFESHSHCLPVHLPGACTIGSLPASMPHPSLCLLAAP